MPLGAIKAYMANRTPGDAILLLEQQNEFITQKRFELQGIQDMLAAKLQKLRLGVQVTDTTIRLVHQKETPIFISDPIEKEKNDIYDDECSNLHTLYYTPKSTAKFYISNSYQEKHGLPKTQDFLHPH